MHRFPSRYIAGLAALAAASLTALHSPAAGQDRRNRDAASSQCLAMLGQTVAVSSFAEVRDQLPTIAPRDAYESSSDYAARLAAATMPDQTFIIRRIPPYANEGLSYNPDSRTLTVYRTAFGAGKVNFGQVMGGASARGRDNFANAIGFLVGETVLSTETYEATNGFGAHVTVTRSNRRLETLWERDGELGEDPFEGMRSGHVAVLSMDPAAARELIEQGSAALMFVPRASYRISGTSELRGTFQNPRERVDEVEIVTGDIRCGFLLDGSNTVRHAFEVR